MDFSRSDSVVEGTFVVGGRYECGALIGRGGMAEKVRPSTPSTPVPPPGPGHGKHHGNGGNDGSGNGNADG
jgi:hypothetical protein